MNILVVDDNDDVRSMLLFVLSAKGHRVVSATNGQEAMTAVAQFLPDIILTDMVMPVMNGSEFVSALRRIPDYRSIPVVVISGSDEVLNDATIQNDPLVIVMTKPVSIPHLSGTLSAFQVAHNRNGR